jgi:hypothetical protein
VGKKYCDHLDPGGIKSIESLLPQHQIDDPAAADVLPRLAAVEQDIRVRAAGFFEGIREDRQPVEDAILVDRGGDGLHGRRNPSGICGDGPEGIAEKPVPNSPVCDYHCDVNTVGRRVVNITLPDEMRENLEARAKSAGCENIDEFVEEVMTGDQLPSGFDEPAIQLRLQILIDEAMASGEATPVTSEFWDRLNAKVAERLAGAPGK